MPLNGFPYFKGGAGDPPGQPVEIATLPRRKFSGGYIAGPELQAAVREDRSMPIAQTVLPIVNEMFDIAEERYWMTQRHPPMAIFVILTLMVLVSALLAGFGMAKAPQLSRLHVFGFAAVTTIALYLIIDLEFPRLGLVRVDNFDREVLELRDSMQ